MFDKFRRCILLMVFGEVALEPFLPFLFHTCYPVHLYAYKWWTDISRTRIFELRPEFSAIVCYSTPAFRQCSGFFLLFSYKPDFCRSGMFCNVWMCIEDGNIPCRECVNQALFCCTTYCPKNRFSFLQPDKHHICGSMLLASVRMPCRWCVDQGMICESTYWL